MANGGVLNLGLAVVLVGNGLQLVGNTLSVITGQSNVNAVIAPAGFGLVLAGGDNGGAIVLSDGPTQTITISGAFQGLSASVNNQAGAYTMTTADYYVGYVGSGPQTFNVVGPASSNTNRLYVVKNRAVSGVLTINAAGSGSIWTTGAQPTITCQPGECATLISDGTYWVLTDKLAGASS